jgi:hypothetical protein
MHLIVSKKLRINNFLRRYLMKKATKILLTAAIITAMLIVAMPVGAASVTPVIVPGNPTCTDLGFDYGFKVQVEDYNGTFDIDGFHTVTVSSADNKTFNWSSDLGMDAVVAKGGQQGANVYYYVPESFGDSGLQPPNNPSGEPAGISHINFCFDYEVDVAKTANTTYTRTWAWEIEKSVTPAEWDLFTGDSGTSMYTVAVTKTGYTDSDWAVNGSITIDNNTPVAATIESVTDVISGGIGSVTPDCGVTFPYVLASGGTLTCTYSKDLPDTTSLINTATVETSGVVGGGVATAGINFGAPTTVVNGTINVDDTYAGNLGEFSDSGSVYYNRTFACDGDEGEHGNTATIIETGQSDSASVDVTCYELMVTKGADTAFTRTWDWTIDKSADQTHLLLSDGQLFTVNYTVVVDASSVDSDHAVAGDISVYNPAPMAARLNSVADVVSPAIAAVVDCGVTFPYDLASLDTLNCTYTADLPDDADRTNTATATLQNYDYDSEGVGTANGTTGFTGSANVSFAAAVMTEIDECIDVTDTNVGVLGTVCASDAPETFNYSLTFGKHVDADVVLECEENTHVNTASFVTNDTASIGSDTWTVIADVACLHGCTLTQGYWKTHSQKGPAPYDDAWGNLSFLEEDTPFYISLKTWYQVFWTPPAGNPYYNLAHQYMAAKLNILNGASTTPAVDAAMTSANSFFLTHTPGSKLSKTERANVLMWAATLDQYNNGYIGPGHCDE